MATYIKHYEFIDTLGKGNHDLAASGDTLRAYLSNTLPNATTHYWRHATGGTGALVEIASGGGYTQGGTDVVNSWTGTTTWSLGSTSSITWSATSAMSDFRSVAVFNDSTTTATGDDYTDILVGSWDYGSTLSLSTGDSFTVNFTGNKIFTLA